MRRLALLLVLSALGVSVPGNAPAQGTPRIDFVRVDLEIGGRITEIVTEDLDGDGRRDLLVVRGRELLVFFQSARGTWTTQANQRFRFHPRTILFDVGDVDGDGKAEIVLLQKRGVYAYSLRQRAGGALLYGLRPKLLVKCRSFFTRPVKKEVRRKLLLRDLDRDKRPDLVVPIGSGFSILRNLGKGFAPPVVLSAPPEAVLNPGKDRLSSQLFAAYWFPNPNVAQWDAQGGSEIVMAREGSLHVFGAAKAGQLPIRKRGTYEIPEQKQFSRTVENPLELDFTMPLIVSDLDGDRRVDVSSTHVGNGTTRIYRNAKQAAQAFKKPARSIRAKGVTFFSYYVDLDGDGLQDLILPRIDKISVWGILKVLLTRSVPVEMLAYYQRKGEFFRGEPDDARELDVPLSMDSRGRGIRFGTTVVATVDGDYDGDGIKDLLFRTDDDTLSFYRGVAKRGMEKSVSYTAKVPSLDDYRFCLPLVRDLDGDGHDDVVLRYWSWDRKGDRITILRARRVN